MPDLIKKNFIFFICLLSGILGFNSEVHAQYGLGFFGHETIIEKRTGLNLSKDKPIKFKDNLELSFEFSFMPNHSDYFGYLLRIITNDNMNIDLLYDRSETEVNHFKVVLGEKFSNITFDIDSNKLFNEWIPLSIKLDARSDLISVKCGDQVYTQQLMLDKSALQVFFGANDYKEFATSDVPAMKVRNVQIFEKGRLLHHWLLDEQASTEVADVIDGKIALASNPQWIRQSHAKWNELQKISIGGRSSVAFNPKTESIYVVGRDSLLDIHVPTNEKTVLEYQSGPLLLVNGNQSYFDTLYGQLLNISVDQQTISAFDFVKRSWSKNFTYPGEGTNYLHFNKFRSSLDSGLYTIGGYGHFLFKNEVYRYGPDGGVKNLSVGGDKFVPRYLAALGPTTNGAYIIGGYGSASGQQMLKPKYIYDLVFFNVTDHTFSKIYALDTLAGDFVWSNSLVIDETTDRFYGLVFPKNKHYTNLQLVEGSLKQTGLKKLAVPIPYQFHDIQSFADLYYCPDSKRFVAVTLYYDESKDLTTAKIYSLFSPPLPFHNIDKALGADKRIYYAFIFVGILLIGAFIFILNWRIRKQQLINSELPSLPFEDNELPDRSAMKVQEPNMSNIFLFGGDLQVIDSKGVDISDNFTPLIKSIFLVILLNTIRHRKGVSSEKLTELFWFDKSTKSARNNLAVNIAKINSLLNGLGNTKVSKESGLWKFQMDNKISVDFKDYLSILTDKGKLEMKNIEELTMIVGRGPFLSDLNMEFLDPFKEEVSIQVINAYMQVIEKIDINKKPELIIELVKNIFYFDPVHEDAMIMKCKALVYTGHHTLSFQTFENYCIEYQKIYGEPFGRTYNSILNPPFEPTKR